MKNVYKLGFYRNAETTPDMFVGTGIYWHNDTESKRWKDEPGMFTVLIGASSRDIKLQKDFELKK